MSASRFGANRRFLAPRDSRDSRFEQPWGTGHLVCATLLSPVPPPGRPAGFTNAPPFRTALLDRAMSPGTRPCTDPGRLVAADFAGKSANSPSRPDGHASPRLPHGRSGPGRHGPGRRRAGRIIQLRKEDVVNTALPPLPRPELRLHKFPVQTIGQQQSKDVLEPTFCGSFKFIWCQTGYEMMRRD